MKKKKLDKRSRKKLRIRKKISGTKDCPRVSIYKSLHHTYAQVINDQEGVTLLGLSTKSKDVVGKLKDEGVSSKSEGAAKLLGQVIASRLTEKNIKEVKFDRNGYVYHGRVKAVAEGAREGGIKI